MGLKFRSLATGKLHTPPVARTTKPKTNAVTPKAGGKLKMPAVVKKGKK